MLLPHALSAQLKTLPSPPPGTSSVAGQPQVLPMNINRVLAWYNGNGLQEYPAPLFTGGGMTYPRGTALAVFASGVLIGGKYSDGFQPALRISGQYFSSTMVPGAILGVRTGQRQNSADSSVRLYRIRRDFRTTDLRSDAADTYRKTIADVVNADLARLRSAYAKDWAEWPWQYGAPFYDSGYLDRTRQLTGANNHVLDWGEDLNHNAFLDPGEDVNRNGQLDGETPGYADADMVLWYVCNDFGNQFWGGRTSGVEVQGTIWAYNRADALTNVVYKRFRMIYKGTATTPATAIIDSMFIGQASDPDLGDPTDDYAGCDSLLNLGYVYNANPSDRLFGNFQIAPPAVGFDIVQGPVTRGIAGEDRNRNGVDDANDFALRDLTTIGPGCINLPMTSFVYFDRHTRFGSRYAAPGFGSSAGRQWYNALRGLPPTPAGPPDPPPLVNPTTLTASTYWVSGDPVSGYGWLDGDPVFPGDREILLSSGPFTMALGDTQEVVIALIGGLGQDRTSGIKVMKYNDRVAQTAYNNSFRNARAHARPHVRPVALDGQVLLEWGDDSASVADTENPVLFGNYRFEGYNVYQFPDGEKEVKNALRIATFDLINGIRTISQEEFDEQAGEIYVRPVQYGTDSGIKRSLLIARDSIRHRTLVNGQRYYFAVTAFNYTPDVSAAARTVESTPLILEAIPESGRPGIRYRYTIGDTVSVRNIAGNSDALVVPTVYNPRAQTGAAFHLRFDTTTSSRSYQWSLVNTATGRFVYRNIADLSARTSYDVPAEGFSMIVGIPPVGLRYVLDRNGADVYGPSNPDPGYTVLSQLRTLRAMNGLGTTQRDYEIRFDGRGSYAVRLIILNIQSDAIKVPFSVWDVGRGPDDTPVRVIASFRDSGNTPASWNRTPHGVLYGDTLFRIFEPIHVTDIRYPANGDDSAGVFAQRAEVFRASQSPNEKNNALFGIQIADKDGDGLPPPVGTVIRFIKFHEIRQGDIKEIRPDAPVVGPNLARADLDRINVFPNPYYGEAVAPTGRVQHRVAFTHLPARAFIRIFNLGGILVRTLVKESEGQFAEWDLKNEFDLPVASGIYLAHIEMPDVRASKVLKLIIIQGEERPEGF